MADAVLDLGNSVAARSVAAHARKKRGPGRWLVLALLIVAIAFTLFPFFLALIIMGYSLGQWAAPFLGIGTYNKMVKQHGSDAASRWEHAA